MINNDPMKEFIIVDVQLLGITENSTKCFSNFNYNMAFEWKIPATHQDFFDTKDGEKLNSRYIIVIAMTPDFQKTILKNRNFWISFTMSPPPPPISLVTLCPPLEKRNVCGSFIFISYWLISHAILSIN